MRNLALLASILCVSGLYRASFAQDIPNPIQVERFLGLNDTDSPATIDPDEAQDMLNVESSISGKALVKRRGYSRVFSLTLATGPINGSHSFIDASGNRQDIICQDHYCSKSTNNTTPVVFISTAGGTCVPVRWSFVDVQGLLYGANDCRDPILKYDGTTITNPATMPAGTILEMTKDRMVIGDVSAAPNSAYYSQSGVYTNFTTGLNSADPYVDPIGAPGDKISGLKYSLGRLFIFKTNSITACILKDQYSSQCYPVSNSIGTRNPSSIVEIPGAILFRGNDNEYWRLDDNGISVISKKITVFVSSQTAGSTQNNTQSGQGSWASGTQNPLSSWDTQSTAGSILPSSNTFADNTSGLFSLASTFVNLSTSDVANTVILSSITAKDSFNDNNFTTGSTTWTPVGAAFSVVLPKGIHASNYVGNGDPVANHIYTTMVHSSSGSFKWTWQNVSNSAYCSSSPGTLGNLGDCLDVRFVKKSNGDFYSVRIHDFGSNSSIKAVYLVKNVSSVETVMAGYAYDFGANQTNINFEVQKTSATGTIDLYIDSVFFSSTSDNAITSSSMFDVGMCMTNTADSYFNNLSFYQYSSPGTIISREYDTGFSTPTWGPFSSTFTANAGQNIEGQVVFYTQVSTSPNNDMYDAKIASSDTLRVTSAQKRYIRYEADLATMISTKTPTISAVSILQATTGQFVSQCIQPGSAISSWGAFNCTQSLDGNGSIVYYTTSAATCAALPTGMPLNSNGTLQSGWTAQTNNTTVTVSTNAAIAFGIRSLLGSATDHAKVEACSLYWNNGAAAPPSWAAFDSFRNVVYWTTAINNSLTNNRILRYDLDLLQWYPMGISANAIKNIQNSIYFGDSTGGYWNLYGGVDSDNGAAINAYWKSKDFGANQPFLDKNFKRISLVTKTQVSGSLSVTYGLSDGTSHAYSLTLSTTSGAAYVKSNSFLPMLSPAQFINVKLGNNSTLPFEVDGMQIDAIPMPWKSQNP